MGADTLTTWWSVYYSDHQLASSIVRYLHLAALLIGGGTAVAIDRVVLRSARELERRPRLVAAMRASHAVVVPALALIAASGALMAAADWSTFAESRWFWIKMAVFGGLLVNGAGLVFAERRFETGGTGGAWRRVVAASGVSLVLWLLLLWIGEWLTVAA